MIHNICICATTVGLLGIVGCPRVNVTTDVGTDAGSDALSILDAGLDVGPDTSPDAPWPNAMNVGLCPYYDYHSPCPVPCDAPPEARFTVVVHWDAAYCCSWSGPYETFMGCRCVDGFAECPYSDYWTVPQSSCELCPRDAMGSAPDAG